MIDYLLKERICELKVRALAMLNQTISDEMYSREMTINDLKDIIEYLDQTEDPVTSFN